MQYWPRTSMIIEQNIRKFHENFTFLDFFSCIFETSNRVLLYM